MWPSVWTSGLKDSTTGISYFKKRTEGVTGAGGCSERVTPDGLTMTTSSDLRLAPHSALASGHMGKVGGMGGMQCAAAGGVHGGRRKCEDTGFPQWKVTWLALLLPFNSIADTNTDFLGTIIHKEKTKTVNFKMRDSLFSQGRSLALEEMRNAFWSGNWWPHNKFSDGLLLPVL